jgi:hypothetical protein
MINKHVNDDEIQQYVLQKADCDIDIIKHIQSCETCKIKAEQYNLLFEAIKQQEKPAFDFNIADLVIEQLPKSRYKVSTDKLFSYFIIFISIIFLSIIFYFFRDSLLSLFKGITPILVALIITTVTCLFVILFIDMYRKYQARMKALNFY